MSEQLPKDALVVLATGAEAKLYRNKGQDELALQSVATLKPHKLLNEGPAGSRPPESSPGETAEAIFSKQLAEMLYQKAHSGEFQHLALVADPDTLGELRPLLHQEVSSKLVLELNKTLINSPLPQIQAIISKEYCAQ